MVLLGAWTVNVVIPVVRNRRRSRNSSSSLEMTRLARETEMSGGSSGWAVPVSELMCISVCASGCAGSAPRKITLFSPTKQKEFGTMFFRLSSRARASETLSRISFQDITSYNNGFRFQRTLDQIERRVHTTAIIVRVDRGQRPERDC
eukprot:m.455457 g.455457  ORF g.455457 m.455457 type:complete len:148 (-) comp20873_c0_seq1:86-529(-)